VGSKSPDAGIAGFLKDNDPGQQLWERSSVVSGEQ
jgi:hypothetical protein